MNEFCLKYFIIVLSELWQNPYSYLSKWWVQQHEVALTSYSYLSEWLTEVAIRVHRATCMLFELSLPARVLETTRRTHTRCTPPYNAIVEMSTQMCSWTSFDWFFSRQYFDQTSKMFIFSFIVEKSSLWKLKHIIFFYCLQILMKRGLIWPYFTTDLSKIKHWDWSSMIKY